MFLTEEIRFLTSFRVAIGASFRGSAAERAKTEPGKDAASVAHLKSARASEDAGWRWFAARSGVLSREESPISCGDLLRLLLGHFGAVALGGGASGPCVLRLRA